MVRIVFLMPYILIKFCMEICPVKMKGKSEYLKVMVES